jgi:hypothetical protein
MLFLAAVAAVPTLQAARTQSGGVNAGTYEFCGGAAKCRRRGEMQKANEGPRGGTMVKDSTLSLNHRQKRNKISSQANKVVIDYCELNVSAVRDD